ncbi:hypothetical protein EV121DRAFT_208837 [Schizophyllum commune]
MAYYHEPRPRSSSRTRTTTEKPTLAGHGYAYLRGHHGRSASLPDAYYVRATTDRPTRATPDVYARPAGEAYVRSTPDAYARATPDGYVRLAYDARGSRSSSRQRVDPGGSRESSRVRGFKENLRHDKVPYNAAYAHVEHIRPVQREAAHARVRKPSLLGQTFAWVPGVSGPEALKRQAPAENAPHPLRTSSRPTTPSQTRATSDAHHTTPRSDSRSRRSDSRTRRWPAEPEPKIHTTEDWVREQQAVAAEENEWRARHHEKLFGKPAHPLDDEHPHLRPPEGTDDPLWDELARTYELDAERWMREQEAARADARARERERVLKEQMHRVEARIRGRREAERAQASEERARRYAQERLGRERARSTVRAEAAWRAYEAGWERIANLKSSGEAIGFASVPWPTERPPARAADVTPEKVSAFLLSDAHSKDVPRKERIRRAQLRWHPDRFQRLLRVVSADKQEVEDAAGVVARCLNDLMAVESARATQTRRATH